MDYVLLGKRVRTMRRIADKTQEQIAYETGLSTSYIGLVERGKRKPSVETVYQICVALGVSADWLMGLEK